MEIRIENGKATIVGATKAELKSLVEFMYGEEIVPYNTVKEIEVEIPTEVASEIETLVEESRTEIPDGFFTTKEAAEMMGLNYKALMYYVNKDHNVGDYTMKCDKRVYVNVEKLKSIYTGRIAPKKEVPANDEIPDGYISTSDICKMFGVDYKFVGNKLRSRKECSLLIGGRRYINYTEFAKLTHLTERTYKNWHSEQIAKVKTAGLDTGKTFSAVYNRMKNDYGIVWEQLKHDFYVTKGYMPKSTIEMVYYLQYERDNGNEKFGNLFEGILDNVLANK